MGTRQAVVLGILVALIVGLTAGFAGGYYYKDFRAEELDLGDLGGGSYFTQNSISVIAVIDPDSKKPKFSELSAVGTYSDIFTCPTSSEWRNVTPSFIWNGQNLVKIFPKKVNTADTIVRKKILTKFYSYPGPMKKVRTERGVNDVEWFGEEYLWKIQELDTNRDGEIDYIEAVNTSNTLQGQDVDYVYEFNRSVPEDPTWPLESTLLGNTRIAEDSEILKPIPLCKQATGGGE